MKRYVCRERQKILENKLISEIKGRQYLENCYSEYLSRLPVLITVVVVVGRGGVMTCRVVISEDSD